MFLNTYFKVASIYNCRGLQTSATHLGKRNFRKFLVGAKRGTLSHKQAMAKDVSFKKKLPYIDIPDNGTRRIGDRRGGDSAFIKIPAMMPELVVPDLTDFQLRPYVSYRCPDVVQSEFTARDLFNGVYADKVTSDFESGALNDDDLSLHLSAEEATTPEQARSRALAACVDIWEK